MYEENDKKNELNGNIVISRLGATRDMLPVIPVGADIPYHQKVKEVMPVPLEPGDSIQIPRVNAIVVKLFLINFLLIRYEFHSILK
jgi:hypothetical protein